jgi:hypothetical protein
LILNSDQANPPAAPEDEGERNPQQDKPLSVGKIRNLIGAGDDPREIKGGLGPVSQWDLYKDKKAISMLRTSETLEDLAIRLAST